MFENNVVILHNVNAFTNRHREEPEYVPVFAFSHPSFDEETELLCLFHLEVVFAVCNGMPPGSDLLPITERYYSEKLRSLSVSDVVFLNGHYWLCKSVGWESLGTNPNLKMKEN